MWSNEDAMDFEPNLISLSPLIQSNDEAFSQACIGVDLQVLVVLFRTRTTTTKHFKRTVFHNISPKLNFVFESINFVSAS
jgi:hypothetical protein